MNKFYQEDDVWCMRKNQISVGDKHEEFKKNFKILTKCDWKIDDCKPINYYKYDSGGNKCICSKDITTCLAIEHIPTHTKIQVGCVCYKKKTEDKHKEIIKILKRNYEDHQKELLKKRLRELFPDNSAYYMKQHSLRCKLPICVKCKESKVVLDNEACATCQPKNGCLIIEYQEDSKIRY